MKDYNKISKDVFEGMGYLLSYLIEKSITLMNTWQKDCQGVLFQLLLILL